MSSSNSLAELLQLNLDHPQVVGLPAHRRIFELIRRAILDHALAAGNKLPSTRDLARELGCARNTVVMAYEQLLAEGYIEAHTGSGSYVADTLPNYSNVKTTPPVRQTCGSRALSQRGQKLVARSSELHYEIESVTPDVAEFSPFPYKLWQKLQSRHWSAPVPDILDYSRHGGHPALRETLSEHLRLSRSVHCDPEQILITGGTQQSLDLCAMLLCDVGQTVWMENPGYWGAQRIFEANDLCLHAVAVDSEGIHPSAADFETRPRMIYVTPSHQYPTDTVMSLSRRRLLIDFASRIDAWILEDDYDSEFRYGGRPLASMQGLDALERVIYLGTFSKVLYPGIRIGYIVVPHDLLEAFRIGLVDIQRPGQMAVQAALADFIREGHFATHLRNLRNHYGQSRKILQYTLQQHLLPEIGLSQADAGLHMVLHLPAHCDDQALARQLALDRINVKPLSGYYLAPPVARGLVLGYGYTPAGLLPQAARQLATVVNAFIAKNHP